MLEPAIFLAAMGITLLEMSEASAVGLAIYAEGGYKAFVYVSLGVGVVLIITFLAGKEISYFPVWTIRLIAGVLLLYFGLRLARSARRNVLRERRNESYSQEKMEKGIFYTAFSVGAVEAFEAAIVLIALIPISFSSAFYGMIGGLLIVVGGTAMLRSKVRKIKQVNMKVAVSGLLLAFAVFWFLESVKVVSDLLLIPFFSVAFLAVYYVAHKK